ncbi:hypothetical protein MNBD_NITROSPINAE03-1864 [hydrothermal vent metagenome]|uniref:Uncharacterized protein n=1 Tax=hydrothermal vent metagenome TaxID=652676 RepID=A0A3B1BMK6_9ZZZZ
MSKKIFFLAGLVVLFFGLAGIVWIPNPIGKQIISEAKANGYLEYTPKEAYDMAKIICTQCHSEERIKLYCPRCGPPFVAVVPHMLTFIENYRQTKPDLKFIAITEHQAVAIVQVWNALVGNWETDFREQDVLKLIGHYEQLAALYKTPVEKRPIESALMSRDDLKIGHMSGMKEAQRNLGKPESKSGASSAETSTMDMGADHQDEQKGMNHERSQSHKHKH